MDLDDIYIEEDVEEDVGEDVGENVENQLPVDRRTTDAERVPPSEASVEDILEFDETATLPTPAPIDLPSDQEVPAGVAPAPGPSEQAEAPRDPNRLMGACLDPPQAN